MTKPDDGEQIFFTARHLLDALRHLDPNLLDSPLVLVHGKELTKPNLIAGFLPALTPVDRQVVESKKPALLTLAHLTDL
jgi:hypothetical protein